METREHRAFTVPTVGPAVCNRARTQGPQASSWHCHQTPGTAYLGGSFLLELCFGVGGILLGPVFGFGRRVGLCGFRGNSGFQIYRPERAVARSRARVRFWMVLTRRTCVRTARTHVYTLRACYSSRRVLTGDFAL